MTITAPPRPPRPSDPIDREEVEALVEALIEEARQRAQRRRRRNAAVVNQVRIELLFDNGGTPSDPTDDEEITFLGVVKDSTGRSDDFCEAAVAILTTT